MSQDHEQLRYANYLELETLLDLQRPRSEPAEHDELLFIVFHQISELWFKQLLHEIDRVKPAFSGGHTFTAIGLLTRIRRILHAVVNQMDILETLTPVGFSAFRDRLDTASGFQSMQYRELQFSMGMKRAGALDHYPDDLAGIDQARRRLEEPSLVDHFHDFLAHHGVEIPDEITNRPITDAAPPSPVIQAGILERYRADRELRIVFELLTDIDELLQEWRYRHLKVVERTIGNKPGTGGSLGVKYLKESLFNQVFPDLWAIRHEL
ncbi:MAG: tryptophan 2,3-dioxygenase [Acidimicrobiales bacterium]